MPLWADHTVEKGLEGWSWVVKLDKKQSPCMHGHFCAKYSSSKCGLKGEIVFPEEENWNIVSIISRMHFVVLSFECFTCMLFIFQTTVYFVFIRKKLTQQQLEIIFFQYFSWSKKFNNAIFFQQLPFSKGEKNSPKVYFSTILCSLTQLDPKATEVNEITFAGSGNLGSSLSLTERDWNSTVITWNGHWPLAKEE